jgi:RHS repeat-associated protein
LGRTSTFAAVKSMALGNGLAVSNDWGSDGRLASRRLYRSFDNTSLSYLAYRYDGDDNIAAIADQLGSGGTQLYGYDQLDRLNFTLLQPGSTAGTTSYSYTPGTNRLASLSDASGARSITYDARGNTASELRPGGITAATAYDGYARLTSYSRSDAGSYAFTYNGLDDRVTMALPGAGTRRFVYDAGGRVMGEYGLSAADVKAEYIWLSPELGADGAFGGDDGLGGYMPLAVATPDSGGTVQLTWVHGNHLGVPLITTDANGIPITGMPDYLAPGFPGQSRVIADLYYNQYRDYDPSTGRYIQADPIGLGGGGNSFGYVGGNPANAIDPMGLQCLRTFDRFMRGASGGASVTRCGGGGIVPINPPLDPDCPINNLAGSPLRSPRRGPRPWTPNLIHPAYPGYEGPTTYPARRPNVASQNGAPHGGRSSSNQNACDVASQQPGTIAYTGIKGTFGVFAGVTGSAGTWINLRTGATGYYKAFGGVIGAGVEGGVSGGTAPSMQQFLGLSGNLSGGLPGIDGNWSFNSNGDGGSVRTSAGTSLIGGVTNTWIFGCHLHN